MTNPSLVLFNKPYGVQSQFGNDDNNKFAPLADYFSDKSLRVAGRLDATSEGLLILTADGRINKALTHPPKANKGRKQGKTYLVQVEGVPNDAQLNQLRKGILLKDGKTLPAEVEHLDEDALPMPLWHRDPPIRVRKSIPDSWLMMTIYEGKNRQVRRMTAHVALPCLRLIRWSVAGFELGDLGVGESREVTLSPKELARFGIG